MAKSGTQMAPRRGFRAMMNRDPWSDLFNLQTSINELFDQSFGQSAQPGSTLNTWTPPVDVYEDENAFLIKLDLPEVSKDDVKVNLNDNVLSITGERRFEHEDKRDGYHRVERSYDQFYRSFTLPPNVNAEEINAEFRDGVLRLTLPKREEAKPKQIQVKVS